MNNFRGSRYQVALSGVGHTYDLSYADDVFGWVIPFFAAHLDGDRAALDRLTRQNSVRGGLNDFLRIDYTAPTRLRGGEVLVEEFHNDSFRRYFLTSRQSDKNIIDSGMAGSAWSRTGYSFKGYALPGPAELRPPLQAPVCRFFFPAILTHFLSAEPADCNLVRTLGTIDEGIDFWTNHARDPQCPAETFALTRLYNNRWRENDSNHRYTTSRSLIGALVQSGWIDEGVVMCVPL
jgi:serine protease